MRLAAFALILSSLAHAGPAQAQILVRNKYYPKPGLEDAVLATRLDASAVRSRLGLAVGVVLLRKSEAEGAPVIMWECEYPSVEAREADAAKAEASPEFAAVQKRMESLLEKFDRDVWVARR